MRALLELIVRAGYEGGWCFGDQALVVSSLCKKLKILEGSLISAALDDAIVSWCVLSDGEAGLTNGVEVVNDVTTQLPRMEKLTVHPARLECFRWPYICTNPVMGHFQ